MFNAYGASTEWITRDRALLRDTLAAMIEANRLIYREKDKVVPIMVKATDKPQEAVEYAWDEPDQELHLVRQRGLRSQAHGMHRQHGVADGDIEAAKKPSFDQVVDMSLAKEAVEAAGGRVTIGNCKE